MKSRRRMIKPFLVVSCACLVLFCNKKQRLPTFRQAPQTKTRKRPHPSIIDNATFPITDFTPHIEQLIELLDFSGTCGARINLTVSMPFSIPTVHCPEYAKTDIVTDSWCKVLKRIFQHHSLPTNISMSFSKSDRLTKPKKHANKCFENSARDGQLCMINFLEMERMKKEIEYPIIPWENRSTVPIWRGSPWMRTGDGVTDASKVVEDAIARSPRLGVVAWSNNHSNLLDAKIGSLGWLRHEKYWAERATNGMDKMFPESYIPPEDYYTRYQVALVLGGFGAAFRTSIHLSTETAIVLQDYRFKEWFTPMMKPYVHYIPLREDLSDLEERLLWIKGNPDKVREIARSGRLFYERYLSFEKNEEHIRELAFRMALKVLMVERRQGEVDDNDKDASQIENH